METSAMEENLSDGHPENATIRLRTREWIGFS